MNLYIALDNDGLRKKLKLAQVLDNIEEIRRISYDINKGNKIFISWAERCLGCMVEEQGTELIIEVPADCLDELEALKEEYKSATGQMPNVGLGKKVSEAIKALKVSKLKNSNNKSIFYDRSVEEQLKETKLEKLRN